MNDQIGKVAGDNWMTKELGRKKWENTGILTSGNGLKLPLPIPIHCFKQRYFR